MHPRSTWRSTARRPPVPSFTITVSSARARAAEQPNSAYRWTVPFLQSEHCSHMTVNNYFGVLQAVLHGVGIGVLPNYVTDDFQQLVRVLPDEQSQGIPVYLAYPEELRHSKRVAAFRDFVIHEIIAFRKIHESDGSAPHAGAIRS